MAQELPIDQTHQVFCTDFDTPLANIPLQIQQTIVVLATEFPGGSRSSPWWWLEVKGDHIALVENKVL